MKDTNKLRDEAERIFDDLFCCEFDDIDEIWGRLGMLNDDELAEIGKDIKNVYETLKEFIKKWDYIRKIL